MASLLSNLGTWAQQVAEPWLLLTLGASAFLIGLDTFAMAAPIWMLTLVGGFLADHGDRRRTIVLCQSIQLLCPVLLVVLLLTGAVRPWMVVALSAVVGVTDALSMPSFQSIVPSIVRRDQIDAGIALNATQFNLSRVLGPAVAGVLMASVGAAGCFALNAASYLPFLWVAMWILPRGAPPRPRPPDAGPAAARDRRDGGLLRGAAEIARTPHLRGALASVLLSSMLCGPLVVFLPVLVSEALGGGVGDFSVAIAAVGLGGLVGTVALLGVGPGVDRRRIASASALVFAAATALAALTPWLWALPAVAGLAGLAMSVANTAANAAIQATTAPRLRGQAVGLDMLALRGGLSIGSLATGLGIHLAGVRAALLADAALALAAQLAVARLWLRAPLPGPAPAAGDRPGESR